MTKLPPLFGCLVALAFGPVAAEPSSPRIIDDLQLMRQMRAGLGELADAKKGMNAKQLQEAVQKAPGSVSITLNAPSATNQDAPHDDLIGSVAVLSSVYKCGKCDKWHLGGSATAWCLTADGIFVTNHHVFEAARGDLSGICTVDGRVAAVKEILASDRAADVCLFRVDGEGFRPLPMGAPTPVGTKVRVISHPEGRFFFQTSGEVARYHRRPARAKQAPSTWMSITADFARGSSGGPVVDSAGRVVGMVSSTQSIYYESSGKEPKGPLQMVVKNCVPVAAIRNLVKAGKPEDQPEPSSVAE
jgi:S1-C subfamily serine protease